MLYFQFSGVPAIRFGPGRIGQLSAVAEKFGKSALLITGYGSLEESGRLAAIIADLKSAGISITHETADTEPDVNLINRLCSPV